VIGGIEAAASLDAVRKPGSAVNEERVNEQPGTYATIQHTENTALVEINYNYL